MRVGVVAYEMEGASTGVGRYLAGLLGGLREVGEPGWSFVLFSRTPLETSTLAGGPFEGAQPRQAIRRPVLFELLAVPQLVRESGVDLVFSPSYSLPRCSGLPSAVTIHDLSFERLGDEFGLKERWRRRALARIAARRASRILADSDAVRDELCERYRIAPARIGVVPLAVDQRFHAEPSAEDQERLAELGVRPPYLLQVGTLLERRCPRLVVETFSRLVTEHPDLSLVLAGPERLRQPKRLRSALEGLPDAKRVVRLGYAPERALPALYRCAAATIYLSRYEGYGLPPLESLACGTPAITAAGLALDSLWPDYPYRSTALHSEAVVEVSRLALAADRTSLIAEVQERFAALSWARSARLLLNELRRAAE